MEDRKNMFKQIITLAWPVIMEGFGMMIVGVGNIAMVGRLGAVPLAAVAMATLMQMTASIIFAAAGTGAAAIAVRHAAAENWQKVRNITGQALAIGIILGSILAVAGYNLAPAALAFTGAEEEIIALTGDLLRITFCFSPLFLILSVGNNILRVMGKTRIVFFLTLFNNVLTLLVGYMMIFGVVLPELGVYGSAWGMAFSHTLGAILALTVLFCDKQVRLRPINIIRWSAAELSMIIRFSLPAAMEQLALQGSRIAFNFIVIGVGAVQFAGHQVAVQVESISFMPGFGFGIAAMALTGMYLGKGLPDVAEEYVKLTNKIAAFSMTFMGVLFIVFSEELVRFFIADPEVVRWGSMCIMIGALEQTTLAMTFVYSGALRGAGDTKGPFYITMLGAWIFRFPIIYLLLVEWKCDIRWAWAVSATDHLLRAILFWLYFRRNKWKKIEIK